MPHQMNLILKSEHIYLFKILVSYRRDLPIYRYASGFCRSKNLGKILSLTILGSLADDCPADSTSQQSENQSFK